MTYVEKSARLWYYSKIVGLIIAALLFLGVVVYELHKSWRKGQAEKLADREKAERERVYSIEREKSQRRQTEEN